MRELKFRVYDKNFGMASSLTLNDIGIMALEGAVNLENTMQYTGLQDKNGKDIYEGDILAADGTCRSTARYLIEWNEKHCCFTSIDGGVENYIGDIDEGIQYCLLSNMRLNVCEIVGNIYEEQREMRD